MLKIVFGYGADDEIAIGNALDAYNSVEGRKTYHESKVRQLTDGNFRCEVWYTLNQSEAEKQKEAEKHLFIGSEDIDPNDPNWREKWEAKNLQLADLEINPFNGNIQVGSITTVDLEVHRT